MKKAVFLRKIFLLHSYTGLIIGIFLLALGVSGSFLVFRRDLDSKIYEVSNKVAIRPTKISLDSMYRIILHAYPKIDGISLRNFDYDPSAAYQFTLYRNDGNINTYDLYLLAMDPYTGKIIREGWYRNPSTGIIHWILQFHFSFHWGVPGLLLTDLIAILLFISVTTGLIVYRKKIWPVLSFRVKINKNSSRGFYSSLHRIVGVWALLFNLIIGFTGFWLNKFAFDPTIWKEKSIASIQNIVITHNIDSMVNHALSVQLMTDIHIGIPTRKNKHLIVDGKIGQQPSIIGNELNQIVTNVTTGEIIKQNNYHTAPVSDYVESMIFPLHVGSYGGDFIRWLYVIFGLTPGLLSITGFYLWKQKNKQHK